MRFESDAISPCEVTVKTSQRKKKITEPPLDISKFALPNNFRTDIELCLESKKMTKEAYKGFITRICNSIFAIKRYPTRKEVVGIAEMIIKKYPFLKSSRGPETVSKP